MHRGKQQRRPFGLVGFRRRDLVLQRADLCVQLIQTFLLPPGQAVQQLFDLADPALQLALLMEQGLVLLRFVGGQAAKRAKSRQLLDLRLDELPLLCGVIRLRRSEFLFEAGDLADFQGVKLLSGRVSCIASAWLCCRRATPSVWIFCRRFENAD